MCEKTMHRVKGEYWRCMCVREMFKSWKHEPGSRWDWRYSEDETRRVENPQLVGAQIGDGPDVLLSGPHVALQVARRTLPQSGMVDTVLTTRVQRERYRERERERERESNDTQTVPYHHSGNFEYSFILFGYDNYSYKLVHWFITWM